MYTALIAAAVMIIFVLSGIAVYLHLKLHKRQKQIAEAEKEQEKNTAQKIAQIQKDIRFLAKAYLDEQVELNEASLRIHHLANYLGLDEQQRKLYAPFDAVAQQISHIPTHQGWKSLDKSERKHYQSVFSNLETEHSESAKSAALKITEESQTPYLH